MAIVNFPSFKGPLINSYPDFSSLNSVTFQLDAAGEYHFAIGRVRLSSGAGTSKVFSSAGGKIASLIGALVFNDAGSTLRFGIQDVDATGFNDGTFDVYAEFIGGAGGLAGSSVNNVAFTNGTKTIADGDLVAIGVELVTRGATDFIQVGRLSNLINTPGYPYCIQNSGVPAKAAIQGSHTIIADDGTVGWLELNSYCSPNVSALAFFGSSSSPNEYALIFELPFEVEISSLFCYLSAFAATDDFELILYSDPLGTPSAIETIALDAGDNVAATGSPLIEFPLTSPVTLSANTPYAIGVKPTTTNTLGVQGINFGSGNDLLRTPLIFGTDGRLGTRTTSGAFTEVNTQVPIIGFRLSGIEVSGGGGGSTEHSAVF